MDSWKLLAKLLQLKTVDISAILFKGNEFWCVEFFRPAIKIILLEYKDVITKMWM